MSPPTATAAEAAPASSKKDKSSKKHKSSRRDKDSKRKLSSTENGGEEGRAAKKASATAAATTTASPGRLLPVRPRFEPGPAFSRLPAPSETAPAIGTTGSINRELWLLQLPPDWDFSTKLRLSRPASGAPEDVLGVSAATAGTSYSLVADDPSTADGLFAFVRNASSSGHSHSSSGPFPITRRATLLVDATAAPLPADVKSEKENRKKEKKEKKEKKKEKTKEKR